MGMEVVPTLKRQMDGKAEALFLDSLVTGATLAEGLQAALEIAEKSYQGLVIWSPDDVFSAGANLEALMPIFMKSGAKGIAPELKKFQDFMLRVRYAQVPVVSAVRAGFFPE